MPVHRVTKHVVAGKAAKMRKFKANFLKTTGRGFDEDWNPTLDRYGSFAADQTKHFQKLANEDPEQLVKYYNEKRKDVVNAQREGKNLVEYARNDQGKLVHFREDRDGEQNYAAQSFNKGGVRGIEEAKTNIINQARERVLLGLATKTDLVELYRYDHAMEKDNSIGAQAQRAFDDLFDNDFFDGFRYGFGQVLQLGAPIFDAIPQTEGVGEYVEEAGKFIQGDIDSIDTIIGNQNRRAEKSETYENDVVKTIEPFDAHKALIEDILAEQEEKNTQLANDNAYMKEEGYEQKLHQDYLTSQGIDENEYYRRAYGKEPPHDMNNPPPVEAELSPDADPDEEEPIYPMLPEGEEFKQAPLEEVNDITDDAIANTPSSSGLAGVNSRLDKLQGSVDSLISRAKQRKIKHQSGGGLTDRFRRPLDTDDIHSEATEHIRYLQREIARLEREVTHDWTFGGPAISAKRAQEIQGALEALRSRLRTAEGLQRERLDRSNRMESGHDRVPNFGPMHPPLFGGAIPPVNEDDDVYREWNEHRTYLMNQIQELNREIVRAGDSAGRKQIDEFRRRAAELSTRLRNAESLLAERARRHRDGSSRRRRITDDDEDGGAIGNNKRKIGDSDPDEDGRRSREILLEVRARARALNNELRRLPRTAATRDRRRQIQAELEHLSFEYGIYDEVFLEGNFTGAYEWANSGSGFKRQKRGAWRA